LNLAAVGTHAASANQLGLAGLRRCLSPVQTCLLQLIDPEAFAAHSNVYYWLAIDIEDTQDRYRLFTFNRPRFRLNSLTRTIESVAISNNGNADSRHVGRLNRKNRGISY